MVQLSILFTLVLATAAQAPGAPELNLLCLEANVYFEAGNQTWKGKIAVKDVTLNRGGSVCKTVFARKQFSWTHKQEWTKIESFLLDRPELSVLERKAWEESKKAALSEEVVLSKEYKYFHATNVRPYWTGPGVVIGNHKFLKGVK
jgi:spore germination cell wall hydrolase CwlJ-like protein